MSDYKWYPDGFEHNAEPKPMENAMVLAPPPKEKKKKTWPVVVVTALITSIFCTGTFVAAFMFTPFLKEQLAASGSTIIYRDGLDSRAKGDISSIISPTNSDGNSPMSVKDVALKAGPSIVGIVCEGESSNNVFLAPANTTSSGSGIIVSNDGYILTNAHVVEGAKKLTVILSNKKEYDAKIVGVDQRTDLAVVKIEGSDLPAAVLGSSSSVQVGEIAIAIGNPLGQELAGSVTTGVISAVNRSIEVDGRQYTLIQTDAAINPGNSGGALFNAYGEVIGINSVKMSSTGVEGIGFAIPSDVAKPILADLISVGYVQGRPLLGIVGRNVTSDMSQYYKIPEGIYVTGVTEFSGAETAGVKPGDVIIKCNGETVKTTAELNAIRDKHKAGDSIVLTISRSGETKEITVILTEEKPDAPSSNNGNKTPSLPFR